MTTDDLGYLAAAAESCYLDRDDNFVIRECPVCGRLIDDGAYALCWRCHLDAKALEEIEARDMDDQPTGAVIVWLVCMALVVVAVVVGWLVTVWISGGLT